MFVFKDMHYVFTKEGFMVNPNLRLCVLLWGNSGTAHYGVKTDKLSSNSKEYNNSYVSGRV